MRALYCLVFVIFVISAIITCQAQQPKAQKPANIGKETVTAVPNDSAKIDSAENITGPTLITKGRRIVVYYFHGNMRCPTCHNLENFAKSEVESDFADAIKSGKLEWKTVNIETAGNEHFGNDYKLYTKSVIISILKNGKEVSWKNLDQIWPLAHNEAGYREYIKREVKACMTEKCL